jgi:hypothetical protein
MAIMMMPKRVPRWLAGGAGSDAVSVASQCLTQGEIDGTARLACDPVSGCRLVGNGCRSGCLPGPLGRYDRFCLIIVTVTYSFPCISNFAETSS